MAAISLYGAFIGNMSDVDFRAWVSDVHGVLTSGGWVQTTDTGQINPVTVTNPNTDSMVGYSIWRSDDGVGGLSEIYMRVEFWSNTATRRTGLVIIVGFSSNGIGDITGNSSTITLTGQATWSAYGFAFYSAGYGRFSFYSSKSTTCMGAVIERARDNSGNDLNEVITIGWRFVSASMARTSQVITPDTVYVSQGAVNYVRVTGAGAVRSGQVGLGFVYAVGSVGITNPVRGMVPSGDKYSNSPQLGIWGDTVEVNMFGALTTYVLVPGDINGYNPWAGGSVSTLMRFD